MEGEGESVEVCADGGVTLSGCVEKVLLNDELRDVPEGDVSNGQNVSLDKSGNDCGLNISVDDNLQSGNATSVEESVELNTETGATEGKQETSEAEKEECNAESGQPETESTSYKIEGTELSEEQLKHGDEKIELQEEKLEYACEKRELREEQLEHSGENIELQEEQLEHAGEKRELQEEQLEHAGEKRELPEEQLELAGEKREQQEEQLGHDGEKIELREEQLGHGEKIELQEEQLERGGEKIELQEGRLEHCGEKTELQEQLEHDNNEKREVEAGKFCEEKEGESQPSGMENELGKDDSMAKLSPFSNTNSEGSMREILLEPLSAEESAPPYKSTGAAMIETHGSVDIQDTPIGPSDEREDISDEELDLDSTESMEQGETISKSVLPAAPSTSVEVSTEAPVTSGEGPVPSLTLEKVVSPEAQVATDNDTRGTPSSDDREIIDLKLEDAAGKSENELDMNRQSKGPSEDLEAVSDDELPEASHNVDSFPVPSSVPLIEGGEVVSSSEDEGPDSSYNALHHPETSLVTRSHHSLDTSEVSDGNVSSSDVAVRSTGRGNEDSFSQLLTELPAPSTLSSLAPLEAEPISDEEDIGHAEGSPEPAEGEEAGEIKSPVDISSPLSVPEQGPGLLGEVEPISADESSDTEGELHSADEEPSKPENGGLKSSANFESIDSEDEGELDIDKQSPAKHSSSILNPKSHLKKNDSEYMETISDEENLDDGDHFSRESLGKMVSDKQSEDSAPRISSFPKETESEKKQVAPNFNEHQVELDYEENEGDDGESKPEETPAEPKVKDGGEEGELAEAGGSDKDEGELSDDDCEEGEIKEPGSKKPFVMPICRFFQRGNCTWGVNCRFLHPGINDKGNYQMIEIPGFKPVGVRARIGPWPEQQTEEPIELPPPPLPDTPPVETAWERGLRIAKEQRKKATERKEQEPDFEDKRLNLSVDEERELNKENERMPKIIPKDPYYDQQAFEEDEYYKIPRDSWHTGHYENFEVRYTRETSYSPPYRDKPMLPPARYSRPYSPPVDKFGRDRVERREPFRPEPPPVPPDYPSSVKRPDEWTDPWRRSKSPQTQKRKPRSRSRGRRARRSVSDSSNSSKSSSGSSSGSSRSSRSFSGSSGSSSRSRSPEPAPPGVDRHERYNNFSPSREQPRSAVSVRGRAGYYDPGFRRDGPSYNRGRPPYGHRGGPGGGGGGGGGGQYYNHYGPGGGGGGGGGGYPDRDIRDIRDRGRDDRLGRTRGRSPPDRPLPYVRPRPKSASSRSSSSRSHSRSRARVSSSRSRSRSSSGSSRSSSSFSSSAVSADSEHLYRDLGSPTKNTRAPTARKKRTNSHKDRSGGKGPPLPNQPGSQKHPGVPPQSPVNLDRIPHPRDPKPPLPPSSSGRPESKYASRNAPQAPVKAKDPLKVVGQKSNIKLTLLPKQQQSSLGTRPNPLDSPPPGHKRRLSERDLSPVSGPPAKRLNLPVPQTSALRLATEKAAKLQLRPEKGKSPPLPSNPQQSSSSSLSSSVARAKAPVSPQKQASSVKSRTAEPAIAKAAPKLPSASAPTAAATGTKAKKSMSSRREELLKQLKAVEDAIARKKSKLQ